YIKTLYSSGLPQKPSGLPVMLYPSFFDVLGTCWDIHCCIHACAAIAAWSFT
ncbi:hypothetical protein H0E87_010705, partial [Populus deltoides]